jgi:uncharacterized membrane-anchored protein YjiN (DUF445 family)
MVMPARRPRRLALAVLLGAGGLAVLAFPFRATWWGGLAVAIGEAGVVGGLADWFAVTALFRRPLGLPIPHTALIPTNWQLLASRVGRMVGDRVLTKDYVVQEIARVDSGALLARLADRVKRSELEAVTRIIAQWVLEQLPGPADSAAGLRRLLARQPVIPVLASVIEVARQHRWDERVVAAASGALAELLRRAAPRRAAVQLVDELLARYRDAGGAYPRFWIRLAQRLRIVDRERLVTALHAALDAIAREPDHPARRRLAALVAELPDRLRRDPELARRLDRATRRLIDAPPVARLIEDAARALNQGLRADLARPESESELVGWLVDRLDHGRRTLATDPIVQRDLDRWIKAQAGVLVDRHHDRIAIFIENGVRALGPEGAVRLIEDHAGDDLQYIRVNGTLIGGLVGGALYAAERLLW